MEIEDIRMKKGYAVEAGRVPENPKTRTEKGITRSYPNAFFDFG